jgi:Peptidase family M48
MSDQQPALLTSRLKPLAFHHAIVAYLKQNEAAIWRWIKSSETQQKQAQEFRDQMLRQTYRLEADSHPAVHSAAKIAMERLGIEAPVTLYQAADGSMNASLCFIPNEIHIVFYGAILEKFSENELLALMGHELSHYQLWMSADHEFHYAYQILNHTLSYGGSAPSHQETARLMSLFTEVYADRGAAVAAGSVSPAISILVKLISGLSAVDPVAYLRQASEIDLAKQKSEGQSHPEAFIRAQALQKWWQQDNDTESWVDEKLRGPLSIESLDLLRQQELTHFTGQFLARFINSIRGDSEEIVTLARRFFPDFSSDIAVKDFEFPAKEELDDSTRNYLVAVMFDCAMVDPDMRDTVMLEAAKMAKSLHATEQFAVALKRDLKWTKSATDKLMAKAGKAA